MTAPGVFVAVVGPSGAGKDTLIAAARSHLADAPGVLFPRRVVTRPRSDFEDNEAMSEADFLAAEAAGRFALAWQAHGLRYGVPAAVREAVLAGRSAVFNLSRTALAGARCAFPRVAVVLVTAPREAILARIAARGRESPEAIAARLAREDGLEAMSRPDLTIVNLGPPEARGRELADFVRVSASAGRPAAKCR